MAQFPAELDRLEDVDDALRELFEAVLAAPVPRPLLALVDRLEAAAGPQRA